MATRTLARAFANALAWSGAFNLALLLSGAGLAEAATQPLVLANGALVVVDERASTETVAVRLVVGGGTLDDDDDHRGVAALHAKMLSRGTVSMSAYELARAAEALGGRLNTYAGLRSETIAIDVPAENLDRAVRLVTSVLTEARLDPAALGKEKNLEIGAIAGSRDDPSTNLWKELDRTLFPDHPLRKLAALTEDEVRAVTIDQVRERHARAQDPARLALVVVGNCKTSDVEALARERLGPLSAGSGAASTPEGVAPGNAASAGNTAESMRLAGAPLPPPSPLSADVTKHVGARTAQAQVMIALPTTGISGEELAPYAILRFVLGGFQERLSSEIREKRGYAYWLSLDGLALPTAGWIGVYTGARKKHLGEIETIARAELTRIAAEPITSVELERARRYLATAEARADATNNSRIAGLASDLVEGRPLLSYDERIARLNAVTPADVQALARRLFQGKYFAVLTLY